MSLRREESGPLSARSWQPVVGDDCAPLRPAPAPSRFNRHVVNSLILSWAFFGIFVAFSTVQNLVSSLLPDHMGQYSLASLYAAFCFSALFLATPVTSILPVKWSLIIGGASYVPLVAANLYPIWGTVIPAAVLVGLGAGILWAAQGTYLTAAAANYATSVQQPAKSAMGLFNGIFFCIFQGTQIVGNGISSIILMYGGSNQKEARLVLFVTFLVIASVGVALFLLLGREETQLERQQQVAAQQNASGNEEGYGVITKSRKQSVVLDVFRNLGRVVKLLADPKLFLMIPTMMYSGMEQSFVFSDFTTDVIQPAKSVKWIGFVLVSFGACDAIGSVVMGKLGDKFSKTFYLVVGFICHMSVFTFLVVFFRVKGKDDGLDYLGDNIVILFVLAGVLGVADSCWTTFPPIIASVLFMDNTEAAFSHVKFWQALGSVCVFVWSPLLPLETKVFIYAGVLIVQVTCVCILHFGFHSIDEKEHRPEYEEVDPKSARSVNTDSYAQ